MGEEEILVVGNFSEMHLVDTYKNKVIALVETGLKGQLRVGHVLHVLFSFSATLSPGTPFADLVAAAGGTNQTTTEAPSPFMQHGASYGGQSASRILGQTLAEVAVGVTLDNWSRWALIEPEGGGDFAKSTDLWAKRTRSFQ